MTVTVSQDGLVFPSPGRPHAEGWGQEGAGLRDAPRSQTQQLRQDRDPAGPGPVLHTTDRAQPQGIVLCWHVGTILVFRLTTPPQDGAREQLIVNIIGGGVKLTLNGLN